MDNIVNKIYSAFDINCEYSHVLPFKRSNYVDGLFHLSMLGGAACKDPNGIGLAAKAAYWIEKLLINGGTNARNWNYVDGITIITNKSPQSFAGPCALQWAVNNGLNNYFENKDINKIFEDIESKAKLLATISPIVFWGYKYISTLSQHVNSCMLAHLLLNKKPWCPDELLVNNLFYKYIAGKKFVQIDNGLSIRKPWGSAWLWKQFPVNFNSTEPEDMTFEYTPIALYVGNILQNTLI